MKRFIRNYLIIFAIVVIILTILRQIFVPNQHIELVDIYIYMVCSLVANLPGLIFNSKKELTEKEMQLRILIHFALLEFGLITFTSVMGWVRGDQIVLLAVQIAFIYILVRWLIWHEDSKSAHIINDKLQKLRDEYVK